MTNLNTMRPKVNRDTFFLPDPNGSVYFRNNVGSFRMEGAMIDQWIQKLIPMFNGEYTLSELTDGLPDPYKKRIVEIAETLFENGFVRDVSEDLAHDLPVGIVAKYSSQIEFLDSMGGSGAHRFQHYRQQNVLTVGSGPFFVSLVSALLESGLPKFSMLITDRMPTNRNRLEELINLARKMDQELSVREIPAQKGDISAWRNAVQPFDYILYVSQEDNREELRFLHEICRQEKKVFLPAIMIEQTGMAGPLVHLDAVGCFESAFMRLHKEVISLDPQLHTYSSTAGAMLSNIIAFELFKTVTSVTKPGTNNQFYLLNLETLEGNWHGFVPHPSVTGQMNAQLIDVNSILKQDSSYDESDDMLAFLGEITSAHSGILHEWEEGELTQLPLAQCRVQAVDPLSDGPATLLESTICNGLTHKEAAREAGLAGIEMYASRLASILVSPRDEYDLIGIGAGETAAEGICRALQHSLDQALLERQKIGSNRVFSVLLETVEDDRCRYYLESLSILSGPTIVAIGEEVSGFPVVWVCSSGHWYGSVGLNVTLAMQKALRQALLTAQNNVMDLQTQQRNPTVIILQEDELSSIVIPSLEVTSHAELVQQSMRVLKDNHVTIDVLEVTLEPFWKEKLSGIFGVRLREEASQ